MSDIQAPAFRSSTVQRTTDVLITSHSPSLAANEVARFPAIRIGDLVQDRLVGRVRDEQRDAAPETRTN